jgi:hypothetical protein
MRKIIDTETWPDDAAVEAAKSAYWKMDKPWDSDRLTAALKAALATVPDADEWQPIETAPKGRKVIVGYINDCGNWRTVMGCYIEPRTLDANTDYIDGDEDGYAPEGWYEDGEAYSEAILPTDKPPTHWRPLPAPPAIKRAAD